MTIHELEHVQICAPPQFSNKAHPVYGQSDSAIKLCNSAQACPSAISAHNRAVLIDWLIGMALVLRLLPDTLSIATRLFDRYSLSLSQRGVKVSRDWIRWIGGTCMLIACKYIEVKCPSLELIFAFLLETCPASPGSPSTDGSETDLPVARPRVFLDAVTRIKIETVEVWILRALHFTVNPTRSLFPPGSNSLFYFIYFQSQLGRPHSASILPHMFHLSCMYLSSKALGLALPLPCEHGCCEAIVSKLAAQIHTTLMEVRKEYPQLTSAQDIFQRATGMNPYDVLPTL